MGRRTLALWLLLSSVLWAQTEDTLTVQFHTSVPAARVYLRVNPADPSPKFLGTSDRPLKIDASELQGQPSYSFIFKAPGYLETWDTLYDLDRNKGTARNTAVRQWEALRKGTWPADRQQVIMKQDADITVVFWTYPPGAEVWRDVSSPGATGKPIGISGQPIRMTVGDFWDPEKRTSRDPEVEFRNVKYYEDAKVMAAGLLPANGEIGPGTYYFPGQTSVFNLAPKSAWGPIYWYCKLHPLVPALGVPLVLGLLLAGGTYEVRRRKAMARALARDNRLADLEKERRHKEDQWVGALLGKWRLLKKLGAGGMAVVYQAIDDEDLLLGENAPSVALKLMNVELSDNDEFRKRFEREINVCKKLQDPAIVRVEDFGNQDGHLYLVMEYIDGVPLRDLVREKFPIKEAIGYFEQILGGLAHAHKEGVVHRDLKPDNIMVTKDGRIKIMDFGLARKQDVNTQITQSGAVLGTPAYVSPEQITGGGMNKSSDQYSLGITFYEVLTGRRPFTNEDSVALLFSHLSEQATSMREWRPEIPEAIDRVILRMLMKDPSERYSDLEECLKALKEAALQQDEVPRGPLLTPPEKRESFNTNIAT